MKKKMSKGQLVFRMLMAAVVTIVVIVLFLTALHRFIDGSVRDFSTGWTVNYNGQVTVNADLYKYRFNSRIHRNDVVTMEKTLPKTIGDEVILTFNGQMSACSVMVDGDDIYNYGYDLVRSNKLPGVAAHVVLLPTDAAGKKCVVSIEAGMDGAFTTLPLFHLVPAQNEMACYTNMHIISNIIAFFLLTMGIVLLISAIVTGLIGRRYGLVYAIGSFAFIIGFYTLCTTHVIEMFSRNYMMNTELEYLSLYLCIIPLLTIMHLIMKPGREVWQNVCVGISYTIICTFDAIVIAFDLSKTLHPAIFLVPAQFVTIASIIFMTVGTYNRDKSDRPDRIYDVALIILFAGFVYDVIRYYLSTALRVESRILFMSVLPAISFIFIIMMIFAYLMRLDTHYMHEAELEIADQIAFTDVVTGLHNRTYSNSLFEKLENRPPENRFQIVSFDINGVTKVNDTLGRAAGDMLIKDVAVILRKAFAGTGEVIRMGGDEFIAVIESGKYRDVKTSLARMEKYEAQYEFRRKYEIRVSYGAASSDEKEGLTPEAVYHRATERMYAMKKETKYSTY